MYYPEPISKLMDSFMKLPGIGPKTASRLAFFVLGMKEDTVLDFAKALINAKRNLSFCSVCGHITDQDPCEICEDTRGTGILFVWYKTRKMLLPWKR